MVLNRKKGIFVVLIVLLSLNISAVLCESNGSAVEGKPGRVEVVSPTGQWMQEDTQTSEISGELETNFTYRTNASNACRMDGPEKDSLSFRIAMCTNLTNSKGNSNGEEKKADGVIVIIENLNIANGAKVDTVNVNVTVNVQNTKDDESMIVEVAKVVWKGVKKVAGWLVGKGWLW